MSTSKRYRLIVGEEVDCVSTAPATLAAQRDEVCTQLEELIFNIEGRERALDAKHRSMVTDDDQSARNALDALRTRHFQLVSVRDRITEELQKQSSNSDIPGSTECTGSESEPDHNESEPKLREWLIGVVTEKLAKYEAEIEAIAMNRKVLQWAGGDWSRTDSRRVGYLNFSIPRFAAAVQRLDLGEIQHCLALDDAEEKSAERRV